MTFRRRIKIFISSSKLTWFAVRPLFFTAITRKGTPSTSEPVRWYLDHGLEVTSVYQVVEYDPIPCFRRFGDAASTARREIEMNKKTVTYALPVHVEFFWSGPVTDSWGCVARRTIASEPPTSTAPKDRANVTTTSIRTRSWTCSPAAGPGVERTAGSGCDT